MISYERFTYANTHEVIENATRETIDEISRDISRRMFGNCVRRGRNGEVGEM